MIDPNSGVVTIDELRFFPGSSVDEVILKADSKLTDHGNGWGFLVVSGETHTAQLYYYEGKLSRLGLTEKRKGHEDSWSNWDEVTEQKMAQKYARTLKSIFGKTEGSTTWGRYSSGYDPKAGSSSIWLSYD